MMLRVRFKTNSEDPRPINWPIKHPYWITGNGDNCSVVVAYADDIDYIKANWPEAYEIDSIESTGYAFTDRFPKPDWFSEATALSDQADQIPTAEEADQIIAEAGIDMDKFNAKLDTAIAEALESRALSTEVAEPKASQSASTKGESL